MSKRPSFATASAAELLTPTCAAARQTSAGSPVGSAAAISRRRRDCAGRPASRLRKLASIRLAIGTDTGSANPPKSFPGVNPRGSSSNASGFPRASSMMRSSTLWSMRSGSAERSSAKEAARSSPATSSVGNPRIPSVIVRLPNANAIDSAASRRATKANACADSRSSHCVSSTTHRRGCTLASCDKKLRTATLTSRRSGGAPDTSPNVTPSASRCGSGSRDKSARPGAQSCCNAAKGSSRSASLPTVRNTVKSRALAIVYSNSAVLPMPASPYTTIVSPRPSRAASSSSSSAPRSVSRPRSAGASGGRSDREVCFALPPTSTHRYRGKPQAFNEFPKRVVKTGVMVELGDSCLIEDRHRAEGTGNHLPAQPV